MKTTIYAPLAVISHSNAMAINLTKVPFAIENKIEFNMVSINMWNRIYRKSETVSSYNEANVWSLNFLSAALFKKIGLAVTFLFLSFLSFAAVTINDAEKFVSGNSKITSVAECEKFLWIGTNNGVVRVNKKNEKAIYLTVSNSKLPSNYVTSICVREDGNVWIGTAKGILRFDRFAYIVVDSDNSPLAENYITSIVEDKNNDLWIATAHSGLMKVHNLSYQVYNQKNSQLANNDIISLSLDEKGNVFVNK